MICKEIKMNFQKSFDITQNYLAFLCVTLVLRGQMTARNLSQEMAERVITLDTMQSTV